MPDAKPTGAQILAMTQRRRRGALVRNILLLLVVVGGAGAFFWQRARAQQAVWPRYVTAPAKLAPLRETVTATGKFKGLDSVDVGAQISGRIARVLVDFNDQVKVGQTLAEIIPRHGLPLDRILTIAIPLADAVAAAHQKGITHRDLKPANILVAHDDRVKVLDFGLAKLKEEQSLGAALATMPTRQITGEGKTLGTVAYMSLEQAEGKPVDSRSDIFSL